MRGIAIAILGLGLCQLGGSSQAAAQSISCAKSIQPVADEALQYRLRGNRCEGLFMQPVAASSHIRIIGYHERPPAFKPGSSSPIRVSVSGATTDKTILLHAVSTRFRQYYRMDARFQSSDSFLWDRTVLNQQQIALQPDELAMIACDAPCNETNLRLLPVSLVADVAAPPEAPQMVFISNVDVSKLSIHLVRLPDGKATDDEILRGRLLLALTPEHFLLKKPWQTGDYRLTVTAIPRYADSAVDSVTVVIFLP